MKKKKNNLNCTDAAQKGKLKATTKISNTTIWTHRRPLCVKFQPNEIKANPYHIFHNSDTKRDYDRIQKKFTRLEGWKIEPFSPYTHGKCKQHRFDKQNYSDMTYRPDLSRWMRNHAIKRWNTENNLDKKRTSRSSTKFRVGPIQLITKPEGLIKT